MKELTKVIRALQVSHSDQICILIDSDGQTVWSNQTNELENCYLLNDSGLYIEGTEIIDYCKQSEINKIKAIFKFKDNKSLLPYTLTHDQVNICHNKQYFYFSLWRFQALPIISCQDLVNYLYYQPTNLTVDKREVFELTQREIEVLFLAYSNLNASEIAEQLTKIDNKPVSPNTIGNILRNIAQKFNCLNLSKMLQIGYSYGYNTLWPSNFIKQKLNGQK